jgi:hypothetical protein
VSPCLMPPSGHGTYAVGVIDKGHGEVSAKQGGWLWQTPIRAHNPFVLNHAHP